MIAVSRVIREVRDGVATMRVETTLLDVDLASAPAPAAPLAGIIDLEWDRPVAPRVFEVDVYAAPDGSRWVWCDALRLMMRDPADLRAAFERRDRLRRAEEHPDPANDVLPLVSAPPTPRGLVESLLSYDPDEPGGDHVGTHDPGEADYDAITAIDADADLDLVAEASAVVRRLAGRRRARAADAEYARRATREDAAAAEKKRAAKVRASVRASTMTDDEAGAADIGGFKLINPTRADVLDARKPRRRKS